MISRRKFLVVLGLAPLVARMGAVAPPVAVAEPAAAPVVVWSGRRFYWIRRVDLAANGRPPIVAEVMTSGDGITWTKRREVDADQRYVAVNLPEPEVDGDRFEVYRGDSPEWEKALRVGQARGGVFVDLLPPDGAA